MSSAKPITMEIVTIQSGNRRAVLDTAPVENWRRQSSEPSQTMLAAIATIASAPNPCSSFWAGSGSLRTTMSRPSCGPRENAPASARNTAHTKP